MDITVKIGGEAGQGIQTVGALISQACHSAGYYLLSVNDFESRIRGGHSFLQIRVSDAPITAPSHRVALLVALNRQTYDLHKQEVDSTGVILLNDAENRVEKNTVRLNTVRLNIDELAIQAGGKITANTVAAGAVLSLMGADFQLIETILTKRFSSKGDGVVQMNVAAARLGYESMSGVDFSAKTVMKSSAPKGKLINGSRAAALGALAADCRFAAFYPMSPATAIMGAFDSFSDDFPIVTEQAEDEIAAMNMIIGASYAGVRAMTSTSGGGFCLMTEALGLAAMAETPVVVINAQRPGPATGLPTRTSQSDLLFVINASQDEFPRFVFAPGAPHETFETMIRAFHLSDKYQAPAIILMDQYLCDSSFVAEKPFAVPEKIERFIVGDDQIENSSEYQRFALTADGVSPRALPCAGRALSLATGNEHLEDGHISEDQTNRKKMVEKRLAKFSGMRAEMRAPETYHEGAALMLASWGSSNGAVKEATLALNEMGVDAGCMNLVDIWPFPGEPVAEILSKSRRFVVVECNSYAQLGKLIAQETGVQYDHAVLKYDGRPIYPIDILNDLKDAGLA